MPRRVSLPSADDLFRPSDTGADPAAAPAPPAEPAVRAVPDEPAPSAASVESRQPASDLARARTGRRPSGRVRHDEKMTIYVTSEELLQVEHARLSLRSAHGLAVDRGRLVREALALVLADLEAHGAESALVRRLGEE